MLDESTDMNLPDPLSFRPNPSAILYDPQVQSSRPRRTGDAYSKDNDGESISNGVYRPPKVAAVPYNEPKSKDRRTDRRAPALLSEFAMTMDGAPMLETTSGLSTRPVQASRHTNSASAKRAAELDRINRFEEENMTRLVTTKREAKRRKEDEAGLALGYGVGGANRNRGRKQNGLEAELEGVLGDRGSRGLWEGVGSKLGKRDGVLERGDKMSGESRAPPRKKARFARDVSSGRSGGSKRTRA